MPPTVKAVLLKIVEAKLLGSANVKSPCKKAVKIDLDMNN